jgi:hypothetical protein
VSDTARQFLAFIVFALAWSAAAGLLLETKLVNPYAIFAVWTVGFVWGVGYIAAGNREADYLLKIWLGMMATCGLLALMVFLN